MYTNAQENKISSPNKFPESQNNKITKSEVVTFPIKSKQTTDINFEKNKIKSQETEENLRTEPIVIKKNDAYYQSQITELKRRIQEIYDTPNLSSVNVDKLDDLTIDLADLEAEYIQYKKTK